jgi:hypothetical protein
MLTHYLNDSACGDWLREMRTIEGDVEPDAHDFVSCLKPKPIEYPPTVEEDRP